eukprot:gb/GECG01001014.1/.p1 GENE.gb/GECG01001014.1/~~gb/GECG01001014.1/.p1  ORF type:complete len:112 (+),score=5.46 gb/GECG01001014.1/:1-336(+)
MASQNQKPLERLHVRIQQLSSFLTSLWQASCAGVFPTKRRIQRVIEELVPSVVEVGGSWFQSGLLIMRPRMFPGFSLCSGGRDCTTVVRVSWRGLGRGNTSSTPLITGRLS